MRNKQEIKTLNLTYFMKSYVKNQLVEIVKSLKYKILFTMAASSSQVRNQKD